MLLDTFDPESCVIAQDLDLPDLVTVLGRQEEAEMNDDSLFDSML